MCRKYNISVRQLTCVLLFAACLLSFPLPAQQQVVSDSALKAFSVEELVKLRKILAKERENLIKRQAQSQERGLEISKEFLDISKEENANQDKILVRVAEYYYEEARTEYQARMEEYDRAFEEYEKQLEAFRKGELKVEPIEPVQPHYDFQKAIAIYDLIIQNFPESDLVDDAYYNKAFLLKEMGETLAARQVFQTIIDLFPESSYAAEAYINLAESYFIPEPGDTQEETISKLNKAIQLYKNVLQFKDSPRYLEAMYKLGWSYYRLAESNPDYYTDAIVYFVAVVRDIERLKELDPTGELVRADVEPEALDFIAASFIDPNYKRGGIQNVTEFLSKLGKPKYGIPILENMGNRYAKITFWEESINAYQQLLNMYPDYAYAPTIQKKIADAYLSDGQQDRAFEQRRILFENYNPKSEWYHDLERRDIPDRIAALDNAYRITEEALRTNIFYLYNLAKNKEEENSEEAASLYSSLVDYCRFYLENYPTDENAYEIHWAMALILDTKLHRFSEAFEEYLRVSNDYLEEEHRFDAAINAIAVADTLVTMAMASRDTTQLAEAEFAKLPPEALTDEEKMLAEAYDNFIKLFPNNSETPKVLADAGALYYQHRQFDLARKYYKTMVTKFPKAQQKNIGLISLMNSYFFLGQYLDAEIVAKKVLETPDIPEDQVTIARSRIGESIFKNAEKLEQQGDYLAAAQEYYRVYTDAKDYITFEDIALFKSATNYEKANEWLKAIQTYRVLVDNFPESKYILPALGNIAEDYKELEDFYNVGKALEEIFTRFPDSEDAEKALYNASIFYEKAEAWEDAIRINYTYIQRFPDRPESKDLLFENAKYYLKLGDLPSANRIYEDFTQRYPDDPRTIEAYYQRGSYYMENGRYDSAKVEFNRAISRSELFARTGRDPNLYFAAESYFKLGTILLREYEAITLSYPAENLRTQLVRKKNMLDEVQRAFTKVIELGSLRSFEALYRIAQAYEDFAIAIAQQQLPPNLNREQLLVERNRVFRASVPAFERAADEYKNVVTNIPVLAEKLGINLADTTALLPEGAQEDTSSIYQEKVRLDSSRQVAMKWYDRAKEKISLILFTVAEKSSEFIDEYLRTPSPFTDIRYFAYQDRLLRELIAPAVQTTINAHLKNIEVSAELGLENKYVIESKRKVLLTSNILGEEYAKLFRKSADMYLDAVPILEDLVEKGEDATTPEGMNFYDYQDNIMQIIFYMSEFSKTSLSQYGNTLKFALEHRIENDAKLTTEDKLFNFSYEAGETMDRLSQKARELSELYINKYDETIAPKYQLASAFFEDQSVELKTYSKSVLELAYNVGKEFQVDNIWTRLILAKLAELDPNKYLADLPKEEISVQSDTTWLASTALEPGWNLENFDDSEWKHATRVEIPVTLSFEVFDSLGISPMAIWTVGSSGAGASGGGKIIKGFSLEMEEKEPFSDTTAAVSPDTSSQMPSGAVDTLAVASPAPEDSTGFFRKTFTIPAKPIDGWIALTADNSYRVYLNDEYLIGVDSTDYQGVKLIRFEAFSEIAKSGSNLVAISVTDLDGAPHLGLRFYMLVKVLPTEISNIIARIRSVQQEKISDDVLRKIVILNKNRIITQ